MYCPKCGKQIPDGSMVCPECHEVLEKRKMFDLSAIHVNGINYPGVLGAVLAILGVFLPVVKVSLFGVSETGNVFDMSAWTGILVIIVSLAALGCFVFQQDKLAMICGIAELILSIYIYFTIRSEIKSLSSGYFDMSDIAHMGIGMYLLLLSGVVMIAAAQFYKKLLNKN